MALYRHSMIDKDRNIIKVAYEKTKIYMDKLTDKEIDNYFSVFRR